MISVIVPVYNNESYIERCIKSIINQTFKDLEVVIIDDGSTDKSLDICKQLSLLDSRVKVYSFENHGVSWARNKGIELSQGEYIVFCDSDDYMAYNMLELLYDSKDKADLVLCGISAYDLRNNLKQKMVFGNDVLSKFEFSKLLNIGMFNPFFGGPYNKLFSRKTLTTFEIHFNTDQSFAEDFCFNLNYFDKCESFCIIDELLYNYEFNLPNSLTNKNYTVLDQSRFLSQAYFSAIQFHTFLRKNGVIHDGAIFSKIWKIYLNKVGKTRNTSFIHKYRQSLKDLKNFEIDIKIKNINYKNFNKKIISYISISKLGILGILAYVYLKQKIIK
ncbi:TPA: glycosyltransferase family 2 protein [Streptococcus suis]